jgi:hypothetical protein
MPIRKVFFFICLSGSVFCLVAGYGIIRQWIGVVVAILTGLTWLLARKYLTLFLPSICLVMSVGLAVVGELMGSPSWLMICGSWFALATWDLLLLNNTFDSHLFGEQTQSYENKHLQSLILALGFGLFVSFLGRLFNLQLPFFVLALLVVLSMLGLDRFWGYLKKRNG